MVKSSVSKTNTVRKSGKKTITSTSVSVRPTRSSRKKVVTSRIARSVKRKSKQTLRDILLSSTFNRGFKAFFGLLIIGTALYGVYAFIGNTLSNDIVVSKTEIIARVRKHVALPTSDPEAVVRVQDAETLQKENTLYSNVKEGDYILVYQDMAVVYDLRRDQVVAMKSSR